MKHRAPPPDPARREPSPTPRMPGVPPGPNARRPFTPAHRIALFVAVGMLVALGAATIVFGIPSAPPGPTPTAAPTATPAPTSTPTPVPPSPTPEGYGTVRVLDVGDVILHDAVIKGGLQPDGTYDFSRFFATLGDFVAAADVSIFDFEGTLAGPPYSGFPSFSAPDAVAKDLSDAGFDVAATANNHSYDKGVAGFLRTVQVLRDAGLAVAGTRRAADETPFALIERNGIRVGISNYTWETPSYDGRKHLNGITLDRSVEDLVDSFNPYGNGLDAAIAGMAAREKAMRDAGAELTVFVLHWGEEYKPVPSAYQTRMARALCDAGVDVVFGQHPHVVQPFEVVRSSDGTHEMPVFYSIGNFVGNFVYDTHGTNGYSEDELVVSVTAVRGADGKVRVVSADYLPTYCLKFNVDGVRRHMAIPATDPRAGDSYARIRKALGASTGTATLPIRERTADGGFVAPTSAA